MNCIERYVFKKRNIYITDINDINDLKPVQKMHNVLVDFYNLYDNNISNILYNIYENYIIADTYSKRCRDFWKLIVAYYDDKAVGAFWILEPPIKVFYDSIEIDNNQLLFCSVYVNPKYRGQGIYNQMHNKAFEYWWTHCREKEVITIVEENNVASNKSNQKYGLKIKGCNILIKFLGRNIISIYKTQNKTRIWVLFKKEVLR